MVLFKKRHVIDIDTFTHNTCVIFHPSARWARRGIVVPFVRLRRRTQSFGYYTNNRSKVKGKDLKKNC